jgi:hypothetical protein
MESTRAWKPRPPTQAPLQTSSNPFLPSPTGQAEESCSSAWTRTQASRSWAWQSPQATEGPQRPGNPYGAASTSQSTRNRLLMQLMEDVHLVENRGCGIDGMMDALQKRGLPAPVFEDKRTAFLVKFYQRTPIEVPLADEE